MGCESSFGGLDNQIKVAGGMPQVETDSKTCIVSTNGLLVDQKCTALSDNEHINKCKWARSSDEVNRVKKLER